MPVITTRGFGPAEIDQLADIMLAALERPGDEGLRQEVLALCRRFPLYPVGLR